MHPLRIIAAACHLDGLTYSMPAPNRHHNILHVLGHHYPAGALCAAQGFLLSDGRFVDRAVARAVALDTGQVKDLAMLHPWHLFSEDLW